MGKPRFIAGLFVLVVVISAVLFLSSREKPSLKPHQVDTKTQSSPKMENFVLREAMYYERLSGSTLKCNLCFRRCLIPEGKRGFCRNRENRRGVLYTIVYARPSAVHIDPIEKEPQLHMLPGSDILCIGTAGCNFRCRFCHNWHETAGTLVHLDLDFWTGQVLNQL